MGKTVVAPQRRRVEIFINLSELISPFFKKSSLCSSKFDCFKFPIISDLRLVDK